MWLRVFKPGTYPQGDFSEDRVRRMVSAYDPDYIEAAAVVGHMDNSIAERIENEFSYGWFARFEIRSDGFVWGEMPDEDITGDLARWISEKKLKYVSAEIIEFDKKDSQAAAYLARVAFLGRSIPAVKGAGVGFVSRLLKAAGFSRPDPVMESGENIVRFTSKIDKQTVTTFAGLLKPAYSAAENGNENTARRAEETTKKECSMTEEEKLEFEQTRRKNADLEKQLVQFKAEQETQKKAFFKSDAEAFYKPFSESAKMTPEILRKAVDLDVSFANETERRANYREVVKAQYEQATAVVGSGKDHSASKGNAFSEPEGYGASLNGEIRLFAEKNTLTFAQAAAQLYRERPELFTGGEV